MRINLMARVGILASCAVIVMLAVSGAAGSSPISSGSPGVSIIAQNGFGSRDNSYAWSMYWFKGKLYVGTGRDELCAENQTVQFYFPSLHQYKQVPSPNVRCAKNPFNMKLRAEIWQYTPKTQKWRKVFLSPKISNPSAKYHAVARDMAYRGMTTMTDSKGHTALFAAGVTPDEWIPSLLKNHPPVLMRSYDGVHWQTLHMPAVKVKFPHGDYRPMGFRSLRVWRGHMFVTATPDLTGDGGLFEITNPWSRHPGLIQRSPRSLDIFEIEKFAGALYVGTGNSQTGYGVYRTYGRGGGRGGPWKFQKLVSDGAGRGRSVTSVVSMHVYRDRLYVGSSGWYVKDTLPVSEMIRIAPNGHWVLVVGNPRTIASGRTLYPYSGLYDGFFNPFAAHFWRMATQSGGLYVGTNDWSYLIQQDRRFAWLQSLLAGELGFDLWSTCNGNDWFAVTRDAFTGNQYNFGGRNLVPDGPNGKDLYIGSANQAQGTTIYDDQAQSCSSLVNGPRTAARPGALMTDAARSGTLLSWAKAANAHSYTVLRAPFVSAKLSLKAPPTLPNGFRFDDQGPILTAPGAPGSTQVTLSLPGGFTPVANTTKPYFVDPTHGHYVYEVVAKSASGGPSEPSNIQVVPTAQPAATFGSLRAALGPAKASAASAGRGAGPRQQRLLAAAQAAWAAGHHGRALAELRRLQRAAGDDDDLAFLASRLERRLQYSDLTGAK